MSSLNNLGEIMREQKITKRITISAGSTDSANIPIPSDATVFLKGYGYTWYQNQTYTLSTGIFTFPSRSDQEGSITQPIIYGNPFNCPSGSTLKLTITNNDAASHVYDVVFYIISSEILNIESSGSDLTFNTGLQFDTNILQSSSLIAQVANGVLNDLIDLDLTTYFSQAFSSNSTVNTDMATFDLGSKKNLKNVSCDYLRNFSSGGNNTTVVKIQISDDNVSYTDAASNSTASLGDSFTTTATNVSCRYVNFRFESGTGGFTSGFNRLAEVRAFLS